MAISNDELCQKYIACMEGIKKRTEVVTGFVRGEISVKYVATTVESAALQLRKILELIALSSLVANHEQYSKYRANFRKDWNAKRILETLDKANPKFYPVPTRQVQVDKGRFDTPHIESGYLTKDEFVVLYDRCSTILHTDNPFSIREEGIKAFLFKEVPEWMDKIITLLNHHHVFPVGDDHMYIVLMQSKADGNVHMSEFGRIDLDEDTIASWERSREENRKSDSS